MSILQHEFTGQADLHAMLALTQASPDNNLHVTDLPYRFSSWALDDPSNVGLWVNPEGQLQAWAVMQTPLWTIDYACRPDAARDLHRHILAWADRRAAHMLNTSYGRPQWFVMVLANQAERIRDLEQAGFASQANVGKDSWSKVWMRRSAQMPIDDYALPTGFTVQPLMGDGEVAAYVELQREVFESKNMTYEWRARTLRRPEYIPDLDLVAAAPDGRLAAFCICWFDSHLARGQVEPLGVRAEFRHLGLGRAILSEGLRRLARHGAREMYVETDNYRNAALELYESAGFQVIQNVWVYRKDFPGP